MPAQWVTAQPVYGLPAKPKFPRMGAYVQNVVSSGSAHYGQTLTLGSTPRQGDTLIACISTTGSTTGCTISGGGALWTQASAGVYGSGNPAAIVVWVGVVGQFPSTGIVFTWNDYSVAGVIEWTGLSGIAFNARTFGAISGSYTAGPMVVSPLIGAEFYLWAARATTMTAPSGWYEVAGYTTSSPLNMGVQFGYTTTPAASKTVALSGPADNEICCLLNVI